MTASRNVLTEQASALYSLGRIDEAKALLAKQLTASPEDFRGWTELGRCHYRLDDHEQALMAAAAALSLEPGYVDALIVRAYALRRLARIDECLATAQEAVRIAPQLWQTHAARAEALNAWQPRWPEVLEAAQEAVRLAPEETGAHYALWKAATLNGRSDLTDLAVREMLRIDPNDSFALDRRTEKELATPGMRNGRRAEVYASALAADPASDRMRAGLDGAVFQMLRGTRWLAVLSLLLAGVAVDLFPSEDDIRELPLPLGTRVYVLLLIGLLWAFGAWRRYRKMRAGVRLSVRSLLRRMFWARLVLVQAVLGTLCAVIIVAVPWTARDAPQVVFWAGLAPTLLTIWFDRPRTR
ncbi:translation initiation factor IF-2 [Streptomyces sp. NPDC056061]|uniref:translation initiation factor IF-2 n=1 Tax=Streptomyces sp. NPDC056061 TaxID=3345700 RepID=UPI0035D5C837